MKATSIEIDGQRVAAKAEDTILSAARTAGISIPTLCHIEGMPKEGGCRLCVVEVHGQSELLAACHEPIRPDMVVETKNSRLHEMRREILALYCAKIDVTAVLAEVHGGRRSQEFASLLAEHNIVATTTTQHSVVTREHPYLRFDANRCITCRRCLVACDDIQGQFVFGVAGRGNDARIIFGEGESFSESPCVACGACVDVCPTGALYDADGEAVALRKAANDSIDVVRSVCGYCGVGCNIDVETDGEQIYRIRGSLDSQVNRGHLCAKGRYAHAYLHSPDRLKMPLLRCGSEWKSISWPEAMDWLVVRLREIKTQHGPDALGVFTSSRSTNEAAYLLQRLFRTAIGTNNVDCCARVCHSSTALGLRLVTGAGAATASYDDIEQAGVIVVAGANPTEAHPIVGARIKQAVRNGATLVVIDPRRIELANYASLHLQLRAGTNVALFNALAKNLLEKNLIDTAYIRERTEGIDALRDHVEGLSLDEAAAVCGVSVADIECAANIMGEQAPCLFVHGLGLSELTQGTASVMTLANLGMLTGSIGRAGAGMLPLRGQNNVQGNADMGSMPNLVTGYQSLSDSLVQQRLQDIWGVAPPRNPGLTIPKMLDAAAAGSIRGLWIQGEDVAQSDPNQAHVIAALENLDLLVVQELFMSETAKLAHLVLPAAGALEQEGTFTNGERRVQRVRGAVKPPGEARADWQVARDVGIRLGLTWRYETPADVMDEIAVVAPTLFGGLSYDRLSANGLQWPCPDYEHPGTITVHEEGFIRGRGELAVSDYVPSPERTNEDYPFLLTTGRVLQHYNVGTMTRRTDNRSLVRGDILEINPSDAKALHIQDGAEVHVKSQYGETVVSCALSDRVSPGTLFLAFHFPESHTNILTSSHIDAQSNCPEYKITAVCVKPTTNKQ